MEGFAVLALLVAAAALAALAVALRGRSPEGGSALREALGAQLHAAPQGPQGQVELVARSVAELRDELRRALSATDQPLTTQSGATQRHRAGLSRLARSPPK